MIQQGIDKLISGNEVSDVELNPFRSVFLPQSHQKMLSSSKFIDMMVNFSDVGIKWLPKQKENDDEDREIHMEFDVESSIIWVVSISSSLEQFSWFDVQSIQAHHLQTLNLETFLLQFRQRKSMQAQTISKMKWAKIEKRIKVTCPLQFLVWQEDDQMSRRCLLRGNLTCDLFCLHDPFGHYDLICLFDLISCLLDSYFFL